MNFLWKIGGEAGFGIMTVGQNFCKIAARSGYHIFEYSEYPSLIRGGHNTIEINISTEEIGATKYSVDLLVCLNKETYTLHKNRLHPKSIVVYDPDEFEVDAEVIKVQVPFKKWKTENTAMQVMVNTMALGASLALVDADMQYLYDIIETEFGRKGQEVVEYNKKFAHLGYDHIKQNYATVIQPILRKRIDKEKVVMTANDAFSLAAAEADCRFYAAYPMTPTSNVLAILAGWQNTTQMVVRHSEDEIAVINSALGASYAGVRTAMATSGGGFALMVEALSFAGVAEIGTVVFLGQRPGPATGMPTWTEQGDLLFAVHAGHGEFPKIVLAPGDIYETIDLTLKAFNFADVYQSPVIVIGDKLICESHKSHYKDEIISLCANYHPNYGKITHEVPEEKYYRYKLEADGISTRLIPGVKGHYYQANSYEHVEDGHTTEESAPRKQQVDKRAKKVETYLAHDFRLPRIFGNIDEAEIVFVSWGGNKGAILEAQKQLAEKGKKTAYIHFTYLYPLQAEKVCALFLKNKRYILVENNSHAQFGKLLQMETGITIEEKILRYTGRPVWVEDIIGHIEAKK